MNKEAIGVLTGKFFHSVKGDRITIHWHGTFLGLVSLGLYRVQLFGNGLPSEQRLVPATDMRFWKVYNSVEEMNRHYAEYVRLGAEGVAAKNTAPLGAQGVTAKITAPR